MKISVAIITYNRSHTLRRCLDSLEQQTRAPDEVVVIDSSDDDETGTAVQGWRVVYRHLPERAYQPQARNMALAIAQGDVVAFLDDDTVCVPQWLESIHEGYAFPNVVAVGGPVLRCDESLRPLEKAKSTDRNQNFFTWYGEVHLVSPWIPSRPVRTRLLRGSNMSFLKSKLIEVGGFDEFYGRDAACREETDPQVALIQRGYEFMYMPGAAVYHLQSETGGIRNSSAADYPYWYARNHAYLVDKYFPKVWARLSWLFWSFDPPSLWLCLLGALYRRDLNRLKWIKGLWLGGEPP